jgi:cytochrome P450
MELGRQNKEAWAKPPLPPRCHDIAARVMPFLHGTVREHGAPCVSWFGPVPKVTITDPRLVREVLASKFGHVQKVKFPVLGKLLALGVAAYEGEKWVKHRRILNPAFHAEKLKVHCCFFLRCD